MVRYLVKHKISLVRILEIKVKEHKFKCVDKIASGWSYAHNYSLAENGRNWILRKPAEMTILVEVVHDQFTHLKVANKSFNFYCLLTEIHMEELMAGLTQNKSYDN